jgi:hypothetical protein
VWPPTSAMTEMHLKSWPASAPGTAHIATEAGP